MIRLELFLDKFLHNPCNTIHGLLMMVRFFWYDSYSERFYSVTYEGRYYGFPEPYEYYAFDIGSPKVVFSRIVVQPKDFSGTAIYVMPKPGFEDLFYKEFPKQTYNTFEL